MTGEAAIAGKFSIAMSVGERVVWWTKSFIGKELGCVDAGVSRNGACVLVSVDDWVSLIAPGVVVSPLTELVGFSDALFEEFA